MLHQLKLERERLSAKAAVVQLPGVCDLVGAVGSREPEGLAAYGALVRSLSRVDQLVLPQVAALPKGLATVRALMRPLSCMRSLVGPGRSR